MWPSGHSCARSRRVTRKNDRWRPSWTWRCLQSACRCTGSTRIDPPLLEFVLVVCPASDISAARPLPGGVAATIRPAAATQPTRSALVVSHHFDGLLRAEASSLLHPEAGRGSLRFQVPRPTMADRSRRLVGLGSLPRNAVHTLRRIPPVSSRTASPRPLPSCRSDDYRPPERRSTRTDLKTAPTSRRRNHSPSAEASGSSLPRRRDPASARKAEAPVTSARPAWFLVLPGIRSLPLTSPAAETAGPGPLHRVA